MTGSVFSQIASQSSKQGLSTKFIGAEPNHEMGQTET